MQSSHFYENSKILTFCNSINYESSLEVRIKMSQLHITLSARITITPHKNKQELIYCPYGKHTNVIFKLFTLCNIGALNDDKEKGLILPYCCVSSCFKIISALSFKLHSVIINKGMVYFSLDLHILNGFDSRVL